MDQNNSHASFWQNVKGKKIIAKSIAALVFTLLTGTLLYLGFKWMDRQEVVEKDFSELSAFPLTVPTIKYGFALDTFQVITSTIQPRSFLGDILQAHQVDYAAIDQLVKNAKPVFDVRQIRPDQPYTILTQDNTKGADYFIYEPNVYEYVIFHLKDDLKVEKVKREITTEMKTAVGVIRSSLWKTMTDQGLSYELTDKMEDALQWSIDFHHIQKNDQFKLVYEQNYIEGNPVGVGKVHAAYYKNYDNEYYAIYYENGKEAGYYDLEGKPMKTSFLKAPLKYSRISSYYNLNRLHPILKYRRPHYGTDYAAPYGTPILAVGDGVVSRSGYTSGNGNFVKIRHDDTYETQYLHMQHFAKGVSTGVHVKQGQVIGYVGSTGLATGPHVCFRFWQNGRQVNHLKLNFPPAEPLPKEEMPAFATIRDEFLTKINGGELKRQLTMMQAELVQKETAELEEKKGGNP